MTVLMPNDINSGKIIEITIIEVFHGKGKGAPTIVFTRTI